MASKVSSPATGSRASGEQQLQGSVLRRSWSSATSSTCAQGGHTQMCVCAPSTHAGSFKCRLHRTTSSHHPSQSAVAQQTSAVARTSSSSCSRTVEAQ